MKEDAICADLRSIYTGITFSMEQPTEEEVKSLDVGYGCALIITLYLLRLFMRITELICN